MNKHEWVKGQVSAWDRTIVTHCQRCCCAFGADGVVTHPATNRPMPDDCDAAIRIVQEETDNDEDQQTLS